MDGESCVGIRMSCSTDRSSTRDVLTNVYGPSHDEGKVDFIKWFRNLEGPDSTLRLLLGDFNFIRSHDRNKAGGDINNMFLFNEAISKIGLVELPLKGRSYTWSNMQELPLLEKLDWFFTSVAWTLTNPNTMIYPLAKPISDHVPCVISIGTEIPKAAKKNSF